MSYRQEFAGFAGECRTANGEYENEHSYENLPPYLFQTNTASYDQCKQNA